MGQTESKTTFQKQYPFYPTDNDIETICRLTDLEKDEVLLCWDSIWLPAIKENGKVDYENFIKHLYQNVEVQLSIKRNSDVHNIQVKEKNCNFNSYLYFV